jgi:hypothetical protein
MAVPTDLLLLIRQQDAVGDRNGLIGAIDQ